MFSQKNSSVGIVICFCWEGPSASCCGLPTHPQPWAVCHPIQTMTIGIRIWPLAPKVTRLPFSTLWNGPFKGEKEKLGWVLCHGHHKGRYLDPAAPPQIKATSNCHLTATALKFSWWESRLQCRRVKFQALLLIIRGHGEADTATRHMICSCLLLLKSRPRITTYQRATLGVCWTTAR